MSERQRRIVRDIQDAYRRGEAGAEALARVAARHGAEPEEMMWLMFTDDLRPPEEEPLPESVLLVGNDTAEGFRALASEAHGLRQLPVFMEMVKAQEALDDLAHNPEMARLGWSIQSLRTLEVSFLEAMCMARSAGCVCVGINFGFDDPYRRIPVGAASG